jgi:hypothetical protein
VAEGEARWDSDRSNDEKCGEKERYAQQVLSERGGRERGRMSEARTEYDVDVRETEGGEIDEGMDG